MARKSSNAFNVAYCGIVAALSIVIMTASLIPSMTYVLPAVAGLCIWTISEQISKKWGFLAYAASAALCFMLVPEIEADLFYLFFFGYYPLVKEKLDEIKPKAVSILARFGVFNVSVVIAFFILSKIMNLEEILEGLESFGDAAVYVLWGSANIAFIFYDICIRQIFYAFRKWLKPKINKKLKKG